MCVTLCQGSGFGFYIVTTNNGDGDNDASPVATGSTRY